MYAYFIKMPIIALAYFVSGYFALYLAIPPGFAAPVWPAAGIALAGVLLWGYRYLPAVFLGSFAINLLIASNAGANIAEMNSLLVAGGIATGALLQAAFGTYLIRQAVNIPNCLEQDKDILNIIIRSVISCFVNSTVGCMAILIAGAISFESYAASWFTWWVGDAIGVVLVIPLVILITARHVTIDRKLIVTIPTIVALTITVLIFNYSRNADLQGGLYSELLLTGGLLFTCLLQVLLLSLTAHQEVLRKLVDKKSGELVDSERRYTTVLDNFSDGLITIDRKNIIHSFNPAAEKLFGYKADEVIGQNIKMLMPEQYGEKYDENVNRYISAEKDNVSKTGEVVGLRKDCSVFPIELSIWEVSFQGQKFFSGIIRDISERKKVEKNIQEKDQFQELIMQNVPGLVFVKDDQFRIIQANNAFLELYPPDRRDSIIGSTTIEDYDEKEAELFLKHDKLALKNGYSEVEETILFPDGKTRTLITQKVRFTYARGKNFILGLAYDVTEIKDRNEELIASEERHRAFIESAVDGLITINSRGIIESFNPASEVIFGYKAKEVVGQNITILMPPPYCEDHDKYIENYLSTGKGKVIGTGREVSGRRKDGSVFPLDLSVCEVNLHGQQMFSGIVRDISERKKIEEELLRSNQELERFAYVASHDLQEPLRMVSTFTGLIQDVHKEQFDDKSKKYMEFVLNASQRMQNLVKDLLEYSRADQAVSQFEDIECNDLVKDAIEALSGKIEETYAQVTFDDMPAVYSNPIRISRLLQNLIENGIKYQKSGNHPKIHIGVTANDEEWIFSVADNGIGIEQDSLEQVFVLFKRLDEKEEYSGTGIGLAICKKIVESIGGRIWVESEYGTGSTFYFSIPKERSDEEAA